MRYLIKGILHSDDEPDREFSWTVNSEEEKAKALAEFKQRLRDYLSNKVKRDGWKYLGVWEGWDGSIRLHFHALIFIPDGTLPGENFVETKYNPVTKQVETHTRNTEFNENLGFLR